MREERSKKDRRGRNVDRKDQWIQITQVVTTRPASPLHKGNQRKNELHGTFRGFAYYAFDISVPAGRLYEAESVSKGKMAIFISLKLFTPMGLNFESVITQFFALAS